MKLIIFDLDQTLVDLLSIHNKATCRTFRDAFGVTARLTDVDFAGRSLIENFKEVARYKNIPVGRILAKNRELLKSYELNFINSLPENAYRYVLPGAKRLLQALSKTENVVVLYTGNSRSIVKKVLDATGLKPFFKFAVYGTEVKKRPDMIGQAIRKTEKMLGYNMQGKDVVVIGDSIRDIESGRQFNAKTIAIGTGFHTKTKLLAYQPDYFFDNLRDYRLILKAIGVDK